MYHVIVKNATEDNRIDDYFDTKREIVAFIAKEMGIPRASVRGEVEARADSKIFRDSIGYRVEIYYRRGTR